MVAFSLVAAEQERGVAVRRLGGRDQARGGALDVAGAQADRPVALDPQHVRVGAPVRRGRHRVQVHVEQARGRAAHRQQRHRAGAVIAHLDPEVRQLRTQVVEDSVGADRTRRIAGIERHQRLQVFQGAAQRFVHRFTCAHSVLLMPNSLMKPSASSTPQSADCA